MNQNQVDVRIKTHERCAYQRHVDDLLHQVAGLVEGKPELKGYIEHRQYGAKNTRFFVRGHNQIFGGTNG